MAGLSGELRCDGFIEADTFEWSKDDLKRNTGLTDRQIDDRLAGLVWALLRAPSVVAERVGSRNLWVAVTTFEVPLLRVYLRPRPGHPNEAELLWIEERL